jgi:hypothetical protein
VPEAPTDGQQYARRSAAWSVVVSGSGPATQPPLMEGVAAVGTSLLYARQDHRHPNGGAFAIVSATAPNASAPAPSAPAGFLWADTSVPDPITNFPDAPSDGSTYGRLNAAWSAALPLAGGTLSGPLVITANLRFDQPAGSFRALLGQTSSVNRWQLILGNNAAEGGSNAGSDFVINRFNDAGTIIDSPLAINRATGQATFNGTVTTNTNMTIDGPAGTGRQIFGRTGGVGGARWGMVLGSATAESGGNAGSDFVLTRYTDAGAPIDNPLTINRASSNTTIPGAIFTGGNIAMNGTGGTNLSMNKAAATNQNVITGQTAASNRWQMLFGDASAESGSNAGSNFNFIAYSDTAVNLGSVFSVVRATRVVSFAVAIVNPSDIRLKQDIAPISNALDMVMEMEGVWYRERADPAQSRVGMIAQHVRQVLPQVVHETTEMSEHGDPILGIDYARIVPVLLQAIKELTAEVRAKA